MPEKLSRTIGTIRYDGLFDFQGLYEVMVTWFKRYRFLFKETSYKHKVPTPFGAEQEIEWDAELKITNYYKYKIDIWMKLWEMTDVEVIVDGKKKILTKARIEIRFTCTLIWDWQERFAKNRFTRAIGTFLYKHVLERELSTYWWDTLYYRTWNLHALVKKYLDMQTQWHEYAGYIGEER